MSASAGASVRAYMRVINSIACLRFGFANARRCALRSESQTSGSIAQAITLAARADGRPLPRIEGFSNHDGRGVSGVVDGRAVAIGRRTWLEQDWSLVAPKNLEVAAHDAEADGKSPVWVAWDGSIDLPAWPRRESNRRWRGSRVA